MGYNLTIALINRTKSFLTPIKDNLYKGIGITSGSEMLAPNGTNYYNYRYFKPQGLNARLFYENKIKGNAKDFIIYLVYSPALGMNTGFISSSFLADFEFVTNRTDKIIIITLTDNK